MSALPIAEMTGGCGLVINAYVATQDLVVTVNRIVRRGDEFMVDSVAMERFPLDLIRPPITTETLAREVILALGLLVARL